MCDQWENKQIRGFPKDWVSAGTLTTGLALFKNMQYIIYPWEIYFGILLINPNNLKF